MNLNKQKGSNGLKSLRTTARVKVNEAEQHPTVEANIQGGARRKSPSN